MANLRAPFRVLPLLRVLGCVAAVFLLSSSSPHQGLFLGVDAFNNGAALTPPLGWSTWCGPGGCEADYCDEEGVTSSAQALIDNGMFALGYRMIMIDDCWANPFRDSNGSITWDPTRFPSGMPAMIAGLHAQGFNVSLYTSLGDRTCSSGGRNHTIPGSSGYFQQDVDTFASWGVDGIIADCCGTCRQWGYGEAHRNHMEFSAAVLNANPPHQMYLQGDAAFAFLLYEVGEYYNSFRIFSDHHDVWSSTIDTIVMMGEMGIRGVPGAWSYMDVVMTGGQGCPSLTSDAHCPGQTDVEYQTEYTMWAMAQSPIIVGTDIKNLTSVMTDTLFNQDLIAIHQDTRTPSGTHVGSDKNCSLIYDPLECQIWIRTLYDGSAFVVLLNAGSSLHRISVLASQLGWTDSQPFHVYDLWTKQTFDSQQTQFSSLVESHGVVALLISKE